MNDLRLEVVSRSCQPLRYIRRWISRKPLEIEAWFQRTTNRRWHWSPAIPYRSLTISQARKVHAFICQSLSSCSATEPLFRCAHFPRRCAQIWNSIPLHIRQSQTYSSFGRHLKTHYTVFRKKTPTHIFFHVWVMCGFKQKLQWIYARKGRFWQCRN